MTRTNRRRTPKALDVPRLETLLLGIAQGRLGVVTPEPQLRRALLQAYAQGYQDGAHDRGAGLDALVAMLSEGGSRVPAAPESAVGPAADSAAKSQISGTQSGFPAQSSELL